MMTVAAIMCGLLLIMWTTGADVMKRIAAPMIGGMVSSTILTLVVIPVLYALWRGRSLPRKADAEGYPELPLAVTQSRNAPGWRLT
jgi:Cu/Ag efflux pump CusA